ncbi:hypothetical protein CRUP_025293 [Coryphaenoides rupestris]|nr:hypothetical protein CRUP_025293 [Coryphaenoides rupestris]
MITEFKSRTGHGRRSGRPRSHSCSKGCACLHDDYSLELNMYCSSGTLTQMPANMPRATTPCGSTATLFPHPAGGLLQGLTSLEFLNLQSGQFGHAGTLRCSGACASLAHIHSGAQPPQVAAGTSSQNTPNLASLSLHNNQLSRVEERLFARLSHMWLLNLGWNSLTVLPETVFHELLHVLRLSNNSLAGIRPRTFRDLLYLEELRLSHNRIRVLGDRMFEGLSHLEVLEA